MLGVAVVLLVALTTYTKRAIDRFARVESGRTSLIYARGQRLESGVQVRTIDLARTLARLDYTEVSRRSGVARQLPPHPRRLGDPSPSEPRADPGRNRRTV